MAVLLALVFVVVIAVTVMKMMMMTWQGQGRHYHMRSLAGKHVLITGGSTGIGFSLAKRCLAEGAFVTLVSRTHSKLIQAHDTLVHTMGFPSSNILIKVKKNINFTTLIMFLHIDPHRPFGTEIA